MGCSSREAQEIGCNFTSGAVYNEHDNESSWKDDFITDIFLGLLNITIQSAHKNISPDTYASCAKAGLAICIDSKGNIKEGCTLTQ